MYVETRTLGDAWKLVASVSELPKRRSLRYVSHFEGVGVHSGGESRMTLQASEFGSGIVFVYQGVRLPARYDTVQVTPMATTLTHESGLTIHTIEHVMAALYGCGITDALITLEGEAEVPIMDGSAAPFLQTCQDWVEGDVSASAIRILQPIEVRKGHAVARFTPSLSRRFSFTYDENSPFYAYTKGQTATFDYDEDALEFSSLVAPARTFGFFEDGQRLQAMGLARGASLNNTVVLHNQSVMNQDGLRMPNEMLQHKLLDAMGDVALWGSLIYGHFEGINAGHALNNALLHELARNPEAWQVIS
jgi:UDP-3-O-[3-hydroxymyristoyl] N-acetylglucosamine deacetylase